MLGLVFFLGFGEGREPDLGSQWSTLESGPLAGSKRPGKGWKLGKESEPVGHFEEWTTGWGGLPFLALLSLVF